MTESELRRERDMKVAAAGPSSNQAMKAAL